MTFRLTWRPDASCPIALPPRQLITGAAAIAALSSVKPTIVETAGVLDLRPLCPPIDNQGQISDCVADGSCTALEFMQIKNGLTFKKLSRLFLYYNARLATGDTDKDEGTFVHLAFQTLTTLGTCTEATWPYDDVAVYTRPSWASYQQAYPNKTAAFYAIDDAVVQTGGAPLVTAIKQALQTNHPVVFGMVVDDAFQNVGSNGIVPAYNSRTSTDPGGHCTCLVGYDNNQQRFIGQNSWGNDWGDAGYYHLLYTDLDARGAADFWVPTVTK